MASGTILGKVAITPGGSYLAGATYTPLTVVTNNGSSYLSITTVQGVEPGVSVGWQSYWQLVASIGAGIDSITQTGTSGNVNTYTILYGNGMQFTFDVSNGESGIQGQKGDTGATGPYFTPSVSQEGELSWSNNGELPNPSSVNIMGPKGAPGRGVQVLGTYESLSALQSAVSNPSQGDMYNIGTASPYSVYMYDTTGGQNKWINLGEITGMDGFTFIPSVSQQGEISWSNNGNLPNPDPVNITGPQGPQGVTFIPSVSQELILSWTNNGGLENPSPVDLTGASAIFVQNVVANSWVPNTDTPWSTQGYGYQSIIQIPDCTEKMYPLVTFGEVDAESGNYSASVQSSAGAVIVYAKQPPASGGITIPTIALLT